MARTLPTLALILLSWSWLACVSLQPAQGLSTEIDIPDDDLSPSTPQAPVQDDTARQREATALAQLELQALQQVVAATRKTTPDKLQLKELFFLEGWALVMMSDGDMLLCRKAADRWGVVSAGRTIQVPADAPEQIKFRFGTGPVLGRPATAATPPFNLKALTQGIELETVLTRQAPREALTLIISPSAISLAGQLHDKPDQRCSFVLSGQVEKVLDLDNGEARDEDMSRSQRFLITPLFEALKLHAKDHRQATRCLTYQFTGQLNILADRDTSPALLSEVLATASEAGFNDVQRVVLDGERQLSAVAVPPMRTTLR